MSTVHKIKRNDTWPPLRAILLQADNTPIDLTGASVEIFHEYYTHYTSYHYT